MQPGEMLGSLLAPCPVIFKLEVALPGEARLVCQRRTLERQRQIERGIGLAWSLLYGTGGRGDRIHTEPGPLLLGKREVGGSEIAQDG